MDFTKALLQFMDADMETPLPYGIFHLLCLAITVTLAVILALRGKKMQRNTVSRIVFVTAIVTLVLEIYKQINFTFGDGSTAPNYQWYAFPWQFCSTPMYVSLLAGVCRKGKLHDALCAYLASFALFAGMAVMVYPKYRLY